MENSKQLQNSNEDSKMSTDQNNDTKNNEMAATTDGSSNNKDCPKCKICKKRLGRRSKLVRYLWICVLIYYLCSWYTRVCVLCRFLFSRVPSTFTCTISRPPHCKTKSILTMLLHNTLSSQIYYILIILSYNNHKTVSNKHAWNAATIQHVNHIARHVPNYRRNKQYSMVQITSHALPMPNVHRRYLPVVFTIRTFRTLVKLSLFGTYTILWRMINGVMMLYVNLRGIIIIITKGLLLNWIM